MPLVSVCIGVSRPDTVRMTIQSIIQQTWKDWEIIAVGQGDPQKPSVIKIREIFQDYFNSDQRIKYVHIDIPGFSRAKNAAIATAQGEIIAGIDDDAEASPDWLEVMVRYFAVHLDVDLVGGSVKKPKKKHKGLATCPSVEPSESIYDPALMDSPPDGWNWINCNVGFRKSIMKAIGPFDEYLGAGSIFPAAEDTDMLLRLEEAGIKMGTTPNLVVNHTYGYRYGVRQFMKHQYNYGYGNGGLAAKLTLAGDPRG